MERLTYRLTFREVRVDFYWLGNYGIFKRRQGAQVNAPISSYVCLGYSADLLRIYQDP